MYCSSCGKTGDASTRFCPQCGQSISPAATPSGTPMNSESVQPARSGFSISPYKIGCGVLAIVLLVVGFIAGIFGLIYYITANSDANKLAQEVLKNHPAVRQAIGEVKDIGIPMGSLKTSSGGTGDASLSMSV